MKTYTVTVDDELTVRWYNDKQQLHRENGPAVETINDNGYKSWYLNGRLHRENGPAVEWKSGTKDWYLNGKRHRENGPAIETADGRKIWYLNGKRVTEAEVIRTDETIDIEGTKYTLAQIKTALKKKI